MKLSHFIAQHKHKNYCEIVISPDGDIEYAIPSHLYKLIDLSKESKDELDKMMPNRAAPLNWLCEHTKYAVCWFDYFILPKEYSETQVSTIKGLINASIMSDDIHGIITMEKTLCTALDKFSETGDEKCIEGICATIPLIFKGGNLYGL